MNIIIANSIKDISGIYAIWNINKNKFYIGSSKNVKQRAMNHKTKLNKNKHPIKELQQDYNNNDNFILFLITEVKNCRDLRYFENIAIKQFGSDIKGYNKGIISADITSEENAIKWAHAHIDNYYNYSNNKEKEDILNNILNKEVL